MKRWTEKPERGSVWLIRLIAWLARTVGRALCRVLLYPIVLYFVVTDPMARRSSAEYLQAVRGHRATLGDVFRHIHCFAATLLDRVYMASGDFGRFDITIEGLELVEEALSHGRGCLLLGSHLGSFDLLMLAQRAMDGRPISVMMRLDPRSRLRRLAGIDDRMLDLIPLGQPDCFLRAHDRLRAGGVVALLADRVDGAAQRSANFLGRAAPWPIAPHVLAARSGAPVLACFGLYEGGNRYRIDFLEFGLSLPPGARGVALQPSIERYANLLEAQARRYPFNWFNFYPFWGTEGQAR